MINRDAEYCLFVISMEALVHFKVGNIKNDLKYHVVFEAVRHYSAPVVTVITINRLTRKNSEIRYR
jgi:hypothetical protein